MPLNRDPNNGLSAVPRGRTNMPELRLYAWNVDGKRREEEAAARLTAIREAISEAKDCTECDD